MIKKDMLSNRIKAKIEVGAFLKLVKKYKKEHIECTSHTFFRLSQAQRKIYTCEELTNILLKETPFLAGIQFNNNYALFYRHNNRILKMIISLEVRKVNIVTFYFIEEWQIPKL